MLGQFYPYQLPANWHILHLMLLLRKEFSGTRKYMFSVYSWYILLHILVHRRISAASYYYTFAVSLLLFIYIYAWNVYIKLLDVVQEVNICVILCDQTFFAGRPSSILSNCSIFILQPNTKTWNWELHVYYKRYRCTR